MLTRLEFKLKQNYSRKVMILSMQKQSARKEYGQNKRCHAKEA
jgi:hypothetical protein